MKDFYGSDEDDDSYNVGTLEDNEGYPRFAKAGSITSVASDREGESQEESSKEEIAQRESNQVRCLRVLVFLVLFLAAATVSIVIYLLTKSAEQNEFETYFEGIADKLLVSFEEIISEKLSAMSTLRDRYKLCPEQELAVAFCNSQ